jgi:uncharacterized protein with gpF-like domain
MAEMLPAGVSLGVFAKDDWMPARIKAFTDLIKAEGGLFKKLIDLLGKWATKVRAAVFGTSIPDVHAVPQFNAWWADQVDDELEIEINGIFELGAEALGDEWEPNAMARVHEYVAQAHNRLVRVPDTTYASVQRLTMKATSQGWSMDELADEIDQVLAEAGAERWRNRAMTIARTEAIGAYNAGRYASFQSLAGQLGGRWEKVWLATHDHRTRFTHAKKTGADGQRVPLSSPFQVGESLLMYPGDPGGAPQEVINCRCSILLAREGEAVDLSNRHYRGLM